MVKDIVKKSISAIVSRQTNIFTAASFIVLTTIFSQILGILKYRLLVSLFGGYSSGGGGGGGGQGGCMQFKFVLQ